MQAAANGPAGHRQTSATNGPVLNPSTRSLRANGQQRAPSVSVSVIVPTLNEAANLPHVLDRIPPDYEVVIVDGHSTDGTVDVARAHRPDAKIVCQTHKGKGNALQCGFAAASGDIYVTLDGDGSARPEELPLFLDVLLGGADFAKGSRFLPGGGSADLTRLRRAGNAVLRRIVNWLFKTDYTDLCYGYNAFWSDCLSRFSLNCDGFEVETLINIRAAKARLLVAEVPSFEDSRLHGHSHLRTFRDGWRVLQTIRSERLETDGVSEPLRLDHRGALVSSEPS